MSAVVLHIAVAHRQAAAEVGVIHTESAVAQLLQTEDLAVAAAAAAHTRAAAHTAAVAAAAVVPQSAAVETAAAAAAEHHRRRHIGPRSSGRRSWKAVAAGRGPRRRRPTGAGCSSRPPAA